MKEKKNISSGAQKVENIQNNAQDNQQEQADEVKKSAQNALKEKSSPKKSEGTNAKKSEQTSEEEKTSKKGDLNERKQREQSAAAKRTAGAKKAHAKKESVKKEKEALKEERQKRKQLLKERKLELKEERKARRDMLKNESKEEKAERIAAEKQAKLDEKQKKREHALELKEQRANEREQKREARLEKAHNKRQHALELKEQKQREREEKRKQRSDGREHAPGFGGWLAAVIALGVTTLALGSVVAYGFFEMSDMTGAMIYSYQNDLYELNSVTDDVDYTLAKLSVSGTRNEQIKLLNEVVTQSDVALSSLERLPVNYSSVSNLTKFVSNMKSYSQNLLRKLYSGQKLDETDRKAVVYMYNTNQKIRSSLNELMGKIQYADFVDLMKEKKNSVISGTFDDMQKNGFTSEFNEPPFALDNQKVGKSFVESMEEISSTSCEEKARGYFENYDIKTVEVKGETQNRGVSCYNVVLKDDRNREYYAQISKKGGLLVMFNSFEHCEAHNFDEEQCIDIASKFLEKAGYKNLTPVWINDYGATCEINFVTECDGALVYSEMIKVNVCETRGKVTGMDAQTYVKNHRTDRTLPKASLTMSDCKNMLSDSMEVISSAKAIIPVEGREKLAYEFISNFGGRTYYIYTDANSGEELEIFVVEGSAYGNSLR